MIHTEGLERCQTPGILAPSNPFHVSVVGWRGDQTLLYLPGGGNVYQGYGANIISASLQSVPRQSVSRPRFSPCLLTALALRQPYARPCAG